MFHQIVAVGNLGRDPEMRYTPSGNPVTNFSIATNRKYTGSDGTTHEEVVWFRVAAWGKQAETCHQYLKKGRQVLVIGRLVADENGNPRTFTRNDGTPGASFEINAQSVRFLGSASNGGAEATAEAAVPVPTEDEIPF